MGPFRCDHLPQDVPCRETLPGEKAGNPLDKVGKGWVERVVGSGTLQRQWRQGQPACAGSQSPAQDAISHVQVRASPCRGAPKQAHVREAGKQAQALNSPLNHIDRNSQCYKCVLNTIQKPIPKVKRGVFRVSLQQVMPMPGATDETFSGVYNLLQMYMYH